MFLPPESWKKEVIYGRALDIWALGITIYIIIYGKHPFEVKNEKKLSKSVMEQEALYPRLPNGELLPPQLKFLLKSMFRKNPTKRPTPLEILDNPYLKPGVDQSSLETHEVK